jgi:SAM-dependent methyltransferase
VLEVGPERPEVSRFVLAELQSTVSHYWCVDSSALSVSALQRAGFQAENIDVSREPLPQVSGGFDLVLASEVLEHLTNVDRFLQNCRASLSLGGLLAITTPNLAAWFNRVILAAGVQPVFTETGTEWVFGRSPVAGPARPVGHFQLYTLRALRELLAYHRFHTIETFGTRDPRIASRSGLISALDRVLSFRTTLAANLGVIAISEST